MSLRNNIRSDVGQRFDWWHATYLKPLQHKLHVAMRAASSDMYDRMPDIEAYEMPEAYEFPLDDSCLLDTGREYVPQLATYKQFAGKFEHLEEDEEGEDLAS